MSAQTKLRLHVPTELDDEVLQLNFGFLVARQLSVACFFDNKPGIDLRRRVWVYVTVVLISAGLASTASATPDDSYHRIAGLFVDGQPHLLSL